MLSLSSWCVKGSASSTPNYVLDPSLCQALQRVFSKQNAEEESYKTWTTLLLRHVVSLSVSNLQLQSTTLFDGLLPVRPICEQFRQVKGELKKCSERCIAGSCLMIFWQGKQVQSDATTGLLVCQYTPSTATGLAAGALLFLLIAQLFIMIVTRCLCCGSAYNPGAARTFAILVFIFSWLFFILAFITLIAGASGNKIHTKGYVSQSVTCHQVKKSLFAAGAALTFLTMLFTELYYVLITKASSAGSYGGPNPSVGMSTYA